MKPPSPPPPSGETAAEPVRDAPAFDFYPERWLVGVAAMSDAEQLSYLRLLCHQWMLGDSGLPPDAAALKRLGGKGVTPAVMAKLPLMPDGRRRNARLEEVRREQRERIAKSRAKIALMNAARSAGRPPKTAPKAAANVGALSQEPLQERRHERPPAALQDRLQEPLQERRQEPLQDRLQEPLHDALQEGLPGRLREPPGECLEGNLGEPLNGFLTAHHPPLTTQVPEDANDAGARAQEAAAARAAEEEAAAWDAALEDAAAREAADAAADAAAEREALSAQRAAAAWSVDRSAESAVSEPTPSLATVQAWAEKIGCPPDKAEIWWNEHEARPLTVFGRWTDRDGIAVRSPQNALAAWWQKWKANDHQRATRLNPPSISYHHAARHATQRNDTANAPGRYA